MKNINSSYWLSVKRTIRFGETDAAGVMHFHNVFRWCHESWEESLEKYGLSIQSIFPVENKESGRINIYLPIVYTKADFYLPLYTGDLLTIELSPVKIDPFSFEIEYILKKSSKVSANVVIRHLSIDPETRMRSLLPQSINLWIEASNLNSEIKPL